MKDGLKLFLTIVLAMLLLVGVLFGTGIIGNLYTSTVGKQSLDIQRENFNHSKSFIEGKVKDLAKQKREYDLSKSAEDKNSIRTYILSDFADFDSNDIQDHVLREFLNKIRGNY